MSRNIIETVMGMVVLVVAALFVYLAFTSTQIHTAAGYDLQARFAKIGGLAVGSDVRVSGIKVGSVVRRELDPTTYDAVVRLNVEHNFKVPDDSVASIASEGPLGGKYIDLRPGTSNAFLAPGGTIQKTENYRSLEDQVGEIIFLASGNRNEAK
jgi:phospholipid/cholesterol/gamma-HCH transport system substrate-binding protein